jgi:hypothetical protein
MAAVPFVSVAELIADAAASALKRQEIRPLLTQAARAYRQISLIRAGSEICVHLAFGNAPAAILVFVKEAGKGVAAKYLAEVGGLYAEISKVKTGYTLLGSYVGQAQPRRSLNILSLSKMSFDDAELVGDELLRGSAKAAQLGRAAEAQARTAASRLSKLITDTDHTLDGLGWLFPSFGAFTRPLRPTERVGVRKYGSATRYSGSFFEDKREGFGVCEIHGVGTYAGTWRSDRPFGYGVWKVPGRCVFSGEFGITANSTTAVGISRSVGQRVYLGEHRAPQWEILAQGKLNKDDFQAQGFGARLGGEWPERGLWSGEKKSTELMTKLQVRHKVIEGVDDRQLPELIMWKAEQKYILATERVNALSSQHDINVALQLLD